MIKTDICKALYALPGDAVCERRKPICKPLCAAIIGAALLVINFTVIEDASGALGMTLMTVGIAALLYGAIMTIVRLMSDDRVPYHAPSKSYFKSRERYYDRTQLSELQRAIASGDRKAIDALPCGNVAAITLVECFTKDRGIETYAIYEYAEFGYRIIGNVKVVVNNK